MALMSGANNNAGFAPGFGVVVSVCIRFVRDGLVQRLRENFSTSLQSRTYKPILFALNQ